MGSRDVIIVGAGHNGLVAAILLARAGLDVLVLERAPVTGGAVRTEYPFEKVPSLGTSTGAYLLGLMPPELLQKLQVDIPVKRRDPHYFLPTTGEGYLLFGSDTASMKDQFVRFFSDKDWRAHLALQEELAQLREDIAPTWLQQPLTIEDTAERYVRPALRDVFVDLCHKPVGEYLERFGFQSDLVKAMYAVTDGFSGLYGTWDTPGTGMNFLVHNMCRLPGADGTWMVVEGGMGTVSGRLERAARDAGAEIRTNAEVGAIEVERGAVSGVRVGDVVERALVVVCNADPFRMTELLPEGALGPSWDARLQHWHKPGSTFKVNLALSDLPTFTCLPEPVGQHNTTIHLLPDESEVIGSLLASFDAVEKGRLPEFPTIEWYIHTTVDPTLQGDSGHHNSALFVQWVPWEIEGSSWEAEESRYVEHLLGICDRFAPDTSSLVVDTFPLHPQKIESHFGIRHGHIHHVDNSFGFADRVPHQLPLDGLFSASAGTHPAGSVIGAAGHNAAEAVLSALNAASR